MKNRQLELDLDRIATYDKKAIHVIENYIEMTFYIVINDNDYLYYSLTDLVLDCIELSRRFELVFV